LFPPLKCGFLTAINHMANNTNSSEKPSAAAIAARAFEIWEREGRQQGRDVENWLQAEAELTLIGRSQSGAGTENASNGIEGGDEQKKGARKAPKKKQEAVLA